MNTVSRFTRDWITGLALIAVLALTRSDHFGSSFKLPDASWAMFWLSGALSLRWWWPMLMMVTAAIVDYVVISNGVSSYCVTPAYPFLIPAYLSLWFMGRWIAASLNGEVRSLLRIAISLLNGVTVAFIISNASFFAFAGYFSTLSAWQFTQAVIQYWPGYILHTAVYASTGLLIRYIVVALQANGMSARSSSGASSKVS